MVQLIKMKETLDLTINQRTPEFIHFDLGRPGNYTIYIASYPSICTVMRKKRARPVAGILLGLPE